MMTVVEAFEKFKQKLELTKTESEDAQRRHYEVREVIRAAFDIENDFLTGSYGRHTKTKPLKDIDIFFVLGNKEKNRRDKAPSLTLDAFEDALVKKYGRENVQRGRRCVTVEFEKVYQTKDADGKVLSIDAVPAFDGGNHFDIPDGHVGKWIKSDPEVHAEQATAKNKELDGKWKPLVKMLKCWNKNAGKPIKPSFLVEVMARGLLDPPFSTYQSELSVFFFAAAEGIRQEWPDPAGLGPPVSDQMDQQRQMAAQQKLREAGKLVERAMRAEQLGNTTDALSLWRELFGSTFPIS